MCSIELQHRGVLRIQVRSRTRISSISSVAYRGAGDGGSSLAACSFAHLLTVGYCEPTRLFSRADRFSSSQRKAERAWRYVHVDLDCQDLHVGTYVAT